MASDDKAQRPPGTPPTREQMRNAVHDVMQKVVDDREAAASEVVRTRQKAAARRRRTVTLTVLTSIAFGIALVVSLPRLRSPFPPPTGAAAERNARAAILYTARLVDDWQAARGRLPASLEEIGVPLPGIAYERSASGYRLVMVVNGAPLTFRSEERAAFSARPTP